MDLEKLVFAVLLLVVGALLKLAFVFLKIEIPDEYFNLIVGAIVTWIVALIFHRAALRAVYRAQAFFRGF